MMKMKMKNNVIMKKAQEARDIDDNSNDEKLFAVEEDATLCFGDTMIKVVFNLIVLVQQVQIASRKRDE